MDSMAEMPADEGGANTIPLDHLDTNVVWSTASTQVGNLSNNSTLLYIAVEYVKPQQGDLESDGRHLSPPPPPDYNYEQHVSPLDPNMSSVARYSPVYSEPSNVYNNSIVVHQLVAPDGSVRQQPTEQYMADLVDPNASEVLPVPLSNSDLRQVINNRYLHMLTDDEIPNSHSPPTDGLQLVPESEQEVELLITDQATGISYSVSTQEFLVERCLEDDQQLLDALAPDPLLDGDLLALDENTLKAQLPDIVETLPAVAPTACSDSSALVKLERYEEQCEDAKNERRTRRQSEIPEVDDISLSRLYSISDKPVLSRARATLPESHLVVTKHGDDVGVFAKRLIPKRTLFGPLEGVILDDKENIKMETNKLQLFIELEDGNVKEMDISDENTSNWMCFVRKAATYNEQNLIVNQHGTSLYYVTTKNISPKQELLVGYSLSYAEKHKLNPLKPPYTEENSWPCFECSQRFPTSDLLQKHLNVHDDVKNENVRPRKKSAKRRLFAKRQQKLDILECNVCAQTFPYPKFSSLKKHLADHGLEPSLIPDKFTVLKSWRCDECNVWFESEALLNIHNLQHDVDCFDEQSNHLCPSCQHKFPTRRQLVGHVMQHAIRKPAEPFKGFKCPYCYKIFATRERIQRHLLVHGSEDSKPLQCGTCKKRFLNNSALACHLKTHYVGKKNFECPICKDSFDHVLQLKTHVSQHCENGQYTCPHCGKVFKKYCIIRKHIRAFHCERVHSCPDCSKTFATLDKLRMHLLRHSDHREFLCADCGKQFKRKDKLKEHCKRMHSEESGSTKAVVQSAKKFTPKVQPTDYHRFIYKCHACMVGFKRRGMLVNHLAKRHPDISPDSVPELNLPILRATRDYYCQYCDKVYKSSSKRKAHILKNHPGAALPLSNRRQGSYADVAGLPNPTYSQTVGSVTTHPQSCQWCHKQYASKAKLLQHQRKKHPELVDEVKVRADDKEARRRLEDEAEAAQKQEEEITIDESCFQRDFKVSEEEIMSEMIELSGDKDGSYYHLVSVGAGDNGFSQPIVGGSDSRLYRLLTTTNGLVPPR